MPVVGPHDPQPAPDHHCMHCGASYYNDSVARACCDGRPVITDGGTADPDISPRDRRIALQKEDDGDPDDTVYIGIGHSGTQSCDRYHDNPDCLREKGKTDDEILQKTRAFEKRGTKAPCKSCVLDDDGGDDS